MTLRRRSALAALAAAPAALAAPAVFGQPATRIRIAGNFATEHSSSIAIEGFKAEWLGSPAGAWRWTPSPRCRSAARRRT